MTAFFSTPGSPKSFWKAGLSLHVIVGHKGRRVRLSPLVLVLGATLLATCALKEYRHVQAQEAFYEHRIAELEKEKRNVQTLLQRKDKEKKQALALAESKSDELWSEIHNRDQQMEQLWEAVGKPRSSYRPHRSVRAGRGILRTLQLKRRYAELYSAVEGRQGEIKALKQAAQDYRRDKLRRAQRRQEQAQALAWSTQPSIYPCQGVLTSPFGYRFHPVLGYGRFHSGADIGADWGLPIVATAAGRVTSASWLGGYGQAVTIDHGRGISTLYGHCSQLCVSPGQFVRKGQVVARVGSTGLSTGPHCHYEVRRNGNPIDPVPFLRSYK